MQNECVCLRHVGLWREGREREEGDALAFNDALCYSTLEIIITNTMHVVTFDPCEKEGAGGSSGAALELGLFLDSWTAEVDCSISKKNIQLQSRTAN